MKTGQESSSFRERRKSTAQELGEFRELFEDVRAAHCEHPEEVFHWVLTNERTRSGKVFGSSAFRLYPKQGNSRLDDKATERLRARVAASPALSAWLHSLALELQRIGPHSWFSVSEDSLFGHHAGPYFETFRKAREAAAAAQSTPDGVAS